MRAWFPLGVVAVLASGACHDGGAPARGFGSRQLLADRAAAHLRFSKDLTRLFFERAPAQPLPSPPTTIDLSSLDLATGAETPIATNVTYYYEGTGPAGRPAPIFVHSVPTGATVHPGRDLLTIVEPDTGQRTMIDGAKTGYECCASIVEPMALLRADPVIEVPPVTPGEPFEDFDTLWLGPYKDLHPATPDVIVVWFETPDDDGVLVAAATVEAPRAFGILRLGWDGAVAETLVAPQLTKYEDLPGQPPSPPLRSSSIDRLGFERRCLAPTTGAPSTDARCFLTYRRQLEGGRTARFVHFLDEDRELVLPGSALDPNDGGYWDLPYVGSPHADVFQWFARDSASGATALRTWRIRTGEVTTCELPGPVANLPLRRPDGELFALFSNGLDSNPYDSERTGSAVLATTADGTCTVVGPTVSFAFAPSGERMASLVRTEATTTELAVLDAPGASPRALASGAPFWRTRFFGADRLLAWRVAPEGLGLSWLDAREASPTDHPIAEQLMTSPLIVGPDRLLVPHDYASQEGTATLSVFDLAAGTAERVSGSVREVETPFAPLVPDADVPVAYVVAGRNPSAQDGIWLATVPAH